MRKKITIALLLAALVFLGIAGWQAYQSWQEGRISDAQSGIRPPLPEADGTGSLPLMDFSKMQANNPDIGGWIVMDGIGVDYPVVQGSDNEYYLHHTAEKESSIYGALFLDYRVAQDFSDFNSVVYGHHMKSGRMFGRLSDMKEKKTFETVTDGVLYTPGKTYGLEVFAVVVADAQSDFYGYVFPDIESKAGHLEKLRAQAMHYREIGVTEDDRLLTLSTCSYEYTDARTIVVARLAG